MQDFSLLFQELKTFYMVSVTLIFVLAMTLQIPQLGVPYLVKMCVFIGWAAYGVLPTLHWIYAMGGLENPMVQVSKRTQFFFNATALKEHMFLFMASYIARRTDGT